MSPAQAEVFVVEDDAETIELIRRYIERDGHVLVDSAQTLEALRVYLTHNIARLNDPHNAVFMFDGNLFGHGANGVAGMEAVQLVKASFNENSLLLPWLIGRSAYNDIVGVNFNWSKRKYEIYELPDLITSLPRR